MKVIGMIGGMSWESSAEYYRIVNETIRKKLGGQHSCKCLMYSVDFGVIAKLQHNGEWDKLSQIMIDIAKSLENAGAEMLVICTNTMHLMAADIEKNINIPLIHIVDTVAKEIKKKNLKKVGLLGTKFTMQKDFYKNRLIQKHGIDVIVPDAKDMDTVHDIIYNELVRGIITDNSRDKFKKVISNLHDNGAEGIILGCTEIPLLIKQEDCNITIFDTTKIHAESAVEFALE